MLAYGPIAGAPRGTTNCNSCRVSGLCNSRKESLSRLACNRSSSDRPGERITRQCMQQDSRSSDRRSTLLSLVALSAGLAVGSPHAASASAQILGFDADPNADPKEFTDEQWRSMLTRKQYSVLRKSSTELPFSSPLNKELRAGTFQCAGCDNDVFESTAKFDSGTGWPSFSQAISGSVKEVEDNSIFFLPRTGAYPDAEPFWELGLIKDD